MPVFSKSVLGCALREISTSGGKTFGMKRFIAGPITIAISPIAQHALLHTEINSKIIWCFWKLKKQTWIQIQCQDGNQLIDMRLDKFKTGFCKITQ